MSLELARAAAPNAADPLLTRHISLGGLTDCSDNHSMTAILDWGIDNTLQSMDIAAQTSAGQAFQGWTVGLLSLFPSTLQGSLSDCDRQVLIQRQPTSALKEQWHLGQNSPSGGDWECGDLRPCSNISWGGLFIIVGSVLTIRLMPVYLRAREDSLQFGT